MKFAIGMLPMALGAALLVAVPSQARTYDCTKAGNANKAACKGKATPVPATPAAPSTKAEPVTPTARHYDCTKAGNANKALCKGASAAPAAASPPSPAPAAPSRAATPAAPPVARTPTSHASSPASTNPGGPNGATAMCNDGSYSHSAHRSGTCSGHKGVKSWY